MNIIEAIKTGLPIRRNIPKHTGSNGDGWLSPEWVLDLMTPVRYSTYETPLYNLISENDILADDWEVKYEQRTGIDFLKNS